MELPMSRDTPQKKGGRRPPPSRLRAPGNRKRQYEENWMMRLYVAGPSTRSAKAISNLRRICDHYVPGRCTIEIIDLIRNPELAKIDQIIAIPTLVRKLPPPLKRIIGDLSATEKILVSLEIEAKAN
jgi:circadian clock protein KaiB